MFVWPRLSRRHFLMCGISLPEVQWDREQDQGSDSSALSPCSSFPTSPSARGYGFLGDVAEPDVCHLCTSGSASCSSSSSLPPERVCGISGISARSLLQHLVPGQHFLTDGTSTPFPNQSPWLWGTVYISVTEILRAVLLACFLPPARCVRIWVTDMRQYKWFFYNRRKIQEATGKGGGYWIELNEYAEG